VVPSQVLGLRVNSLKIKAFLTSLGVALGTCFANAHAGDSPALARVGIGAFDIMDKGFAWEVDANYRFDSEFWIFNPQIGALYTGNGDKYGYGGIVWDIPLSKKWHFNASTAAGYYSKGGTDGKDLGGPIEFRTGLELQYEFPDRSRIGLVAYHISNAGIYKKNPGEETGLLTFAVPTDYFTK